jgi:ribonuclease VapC
MVVDSSALIAVLFGEPEAAVFLDCLEKAPRRYLSSFSWFETSVVVEAKKGPAGMQILHTLVSELPFDLIPFDASQAEIAMDAWRRFGKGRHPAGLNLGDCASYALARTLSLALLFKGEDFTKTDLARAR